jgi:caffeoyl-CoA O-methyltransferase
MAKSDRTYEIGRADRDWVESIAEPIHPALAAIEAAAEPERIPIQGPGGSIVTIDPDRQRTDIARAFWRQAGVAIGRITVVNEKALDAFTHGDPALAGPFDLAFIDALKAEYRAYVEALIPRLVVGALVVADNVLWSGRVSGANPTQADDDQTNALREFDTFIMRDHRFQAAITPVGDGLLVAAYRG